MYIYVYMYAYMYIYIHPHTHTPTQLASDSIVRLPAQSASVIRMSLVRGRVNPSESTVRGLHTTSQCKVITDTSLVHPGTVCGDGLWWQCLTKELLIKQLDWNTTYIYLDLFTTAFWWACVLSLSRCLRHLVFFSLLLSNVLATAKVISKQVPTCDSAHSWWLYSTPPLGDQATNIMTWYPSQSHYPDSEWSSPCPIVIIPRA